MIFVTVGSQKFQFDRLLEYIDILIEEKNIKDDVFAQTGFSDYKPKHYSYKNFVDYKTFKKYIQKSDIIVTHGGTGAIVTALKAKKKIIAIPRQKKYREHVDNHQEQIIDNFEKKNYIFKSTNKEELINMLKGIDSHKFDPFISNNDKYISFLSNYINNII